jgi:hypothetical protein
MTLLLPSFGTEERCLFEQRFWSKVRRAGCDECWEWQGCLKGSGLGYGSICLRGRMVRAHRVALALSLNRELLPTEHALHTCDNTRCCNPAHLYPGDHAQNMKDTVLRGRRKGLKGSANPRAKLTEEVVRIIRASDAPLHVMAQRFDVDESLISLVRLRKVWTHVK